MGRGGSRIGLLRRGVARACRVLCALAALASVLPAQDAALELSGAERAWIAAHPVIRIQMSDCSPPFEFREDGVWKGLAYDYLIEAGRRLGLRIEPTGILWARALDVIQVPGQNEVDLLLAVTRGPDRERQMLLTRGYLAFPQVIFASKQHPFISGLADLATSRLVVENEYVMQQWLVRDLPRARVTPLDSPEACLAAISSGQADAYVGNLAIASFLIEKLGLVNVEVVAPSGYGDEEFSMGVRRDRPELVALLDKAIASIPADQQLAMRQRWLSVRYEFGLRPTDIAKWVIIVAAIALVFILQLRRMVRRRTAELKREVELRRSREAHLAEAQRIGRLGSWTRDLGSDALTWSDETYRIFGWDRGSAPTLARVLATVHPDDVEALHAHQRRAEAGTPFEAEYRIITAGGETRHLFERCRCVAAADGRVTRLEGIVLDITDRKLAERERERLETSIRHTEKLRVIGQLASGIAHDFNNQLGGITGYADLLRRALEAPTGPSAAHALRYVEGIQRAAGRAATITSQLRVFSRRDDLMLGPIDLHALVRESAELARSGTAGAMTVAIDLRAAPSTVLGDATQIQTALVNLALNARDAMPAGGTITMATRSLTLHAPIANAHHFEFQPGPYVEVAVTDTGVGIDEAVMAKLFEPFFTTKPIGKGTGLGLANVYGCMKNHRGAIAVESRPGAGATFRLLFPAAAPAAIAAIDASTLQPVPGQGSILVVDDDATLRLVAGEMLTELGYTVTTVGSGREVLEHVTARVGAIDLVIVDMIMPGMDGRETIARIRALDPRIRFVLCSGSFRNEPAHSIPEAQGFLQKPFLIGPLSRQIADVLGARGGSDSARRP